MNFNGPGFVRKAANLFFCFLIFGIVRSQHESHEGTNGKKHLQGIKKLAVHRISEARPIQVTSTGPKRYFSNYAPSRPFAEEKRMISWPQWHRPQTSKRTAPFAVPLVMESRENRELVREEVNFERPVNIAVHAAPTQIFHNSSPKPKTDYPEVNELTRALVQEEMEQKRMERIQARWGKIGLPRNGFRPGRPYNQMKTPHFAQPIAWTHVPTTEETVSTTVASTTTPTTTTPTTTTREVTITETLQNRKILLPEVIKSMKEETMIGRISKHPIHVKTPRNPPPRAYGQRRFFTGKILDEEETPEIPPSRPILVSHTSEGINLEDGPSIQDTSKTDYHRRSLNGGATPVKRFKLTNKFSARPRLKIRKPEEQFAARGDQNAKSYPLAIPELAPLSSRENDRRPLPATKFEEPTAFLTRHKATPGIQTLQQLRPLPLPEVFGEQNIQVEPPSPPPGHVPPKVTNWGDEDFTESITEESGLRNGLGDGDGASGLGAEIGTPPPGFKETFGLNGATMELTTTTIPETTTPYTTTTRKVTTPQPPPDEPFVIPENSGLRPIAPPKEFVGGFGSSKGSRLSGFGAGGGFGAPQALPRPPPTIPRPRTKQPDPELTEEDFFTGDSALTPSKGPTGDGFGPPVFPGAAIPPPVVGGISTGGGAAGIPLMPAYRMINENENEATTVKPSALLSVLNKADEGFNQAITHFEQGTPIESAAIDILEVALGSERLDSQAKLLGHVDRTFGLDNLQRLQRWANTGGAFDMLKEQFGKMLKNYKPPEPTVTLPPQLEYLFAPSG